MAKPLQPQQPQQPPTQTLRRRHRSRRQKIAMWGCFGPCLAFIVWMVIYLLPLPLHWFESEMLRPDEQVVLFVTVAPHPEDIVESLRREIRNEEELKKKIENTTFAVPIHGWVYEPGWSPLTRTVLSALYYFLDLASEPLGSVTESTGTTNEDTTAFLSSDAKTEEKRNQGEEEASSPTDEEDNHPHLHKAEEKVLNAIDTFYLRGGLFLVDNNRGRRLSVRICNKVYQLNVLSAANGHFKDQVQVPISALVSNGTCPGRQDDVLRIELIALTEGTNSKSTEQEPCPPEEEKPLGHHRVFDGQVLLLRERGVSVISDIDDTIKVTEIPNKQLMVRNTFVRPFRPVPNFATIFNRWKSDCEAWKDTKDADVYRTVNNIAFHYVSLSPWQLFSLLTDFLKASDFPSGSLHLRLFRFLEPSILDFVRPPRESKRKVIAPLLQQFPNRKFVLVGDTTEADPEIYTELAVEFPRQVKLIVIRDTEKGQKDHTFRKETLTAAIPRSIPLIFFREPEELLGQEVISLFPCRHV